MTIEIALRFLLLIAALSLLFAFGAFVADHASDAIERMCRWRNIVRQRREL